MLINLPDGNLGVVGTSPEGEGWSYKIVREVRGNIQNLTITYGPFGSQEEAAQAMLARYITKSKQINWAEEGF